MLSTRRMAIANGTCVSFCNQPKAHFGLSGYAPGTIAVNVTQMERGFNACQTHRSIYPSIFNRFQKFAILAHFLHILASPGYAPGIDNRGKYPYPSIFNHLRAIARYWSEIATFSYPLHLTPPLGVFPLEFLENI